MMNTSFDMELSISCFMYSHVRHEDAKSVLAASISRFLLLGETPRTYSIAVCRALSYKDLCSSYLDFHESLSAVLRFAYWAQQ